MNPRLRFDCTGEYKQCLLEDVAEYSKKRCKRTHFLFIGNDCMQSNFGATRLNKVNIAEGIEFDKGAILLGNIRPYLRKVWMATESGVASPDVLVFRSKVLDPQYLKYLISSDLFFDHVAKGYKGSKMPRGDKSQIMRFAFSYPPIEEQRRVATFFSTLDKKIELNERKLEAVEQLKKGLMRKIFKQEIRVVPNSGKDWQSITLGDYFSVKMCKRIFKEQTSPVGDIPFFKIGTFGKIPDAYISKKLFDQYRSKFSYPSKGDTLISCSGTVGRCVMFDGRPSYFQDSNIVWLEVKDNEFLYDKKFLNIILSNLSWKDLSSTTIKRIYSKDLLSKQIPMPCIDEQKRISKIFILFDRKLTLLEEKIELLKNLKMWFLKNMFC